MAKKVSEVLLDVISSYGVNSIFGLPGGSLNHLIEAIRIHEKINFVHVRHEETGAFAASAIGKLTGKLGVCMGTSGPGAIHLLNGLYDAKLDHSPVLAITGQVDLQYKGSEAHQEIDLHDLFEGVSVFNETVVSPDQFPRLIEEACRAAIYKKGVAHISIPSNIANMEVKYSAFDGHFTYGPSRVLPNEEDLFKAAAIINKSKKVTILTGFGALNSTQEIIQIAEKLKAPVVKALRGKAVIPDEHPLSMGGTGLLGTRPGYTATMECDCLLMIGTDMPYYDFYPQDISVIQIDINGLNIGKRIPVSVGLVSDASQAIRMLLPYLTEKTDASFLSDLQEDMKMWWKAMEAVENQDSGFIHSQRVAALINEYATDKAIYCCDTGNVTVWAARHLKIRDEQKFTLSGRLASMAFGLPAAIGAQFSHPDRQVIALCGDGGFSMLMADFLTAVKYDMPLKIIIFNNSKLGMIKVEQEVDGYPEYQTTLNNPDFGEFARNCGGDGEKVSNNEDLEDAIIRMFASEKPFILDVVVNPDELTIPPKVEISQVMGFAKAKVMEFFNQ